MPDVTGVEFLLEAVSRFPDARRVLLTAYAETDAAITAINRVRLDYYLLKPWDPPHERLFPVLDDLLSDWLATYRPAYDGIIVAGHLVSPAPTPSGTSSPATASRSASSTSSATPRR